MARRTGTKPTPEKASATLRFLAAFDVPADLALALTEVDPDIPIYVTNAHGAHYLIYRYEPDVNPWLVYATDEGGHEYQLDVHGLGLELEDSTRVTETLDTKTTEKVIGFYYTGGGQQRVDVLGPDTCGTYCDWNLHIGRRVGDPMTLAEAIALIRQNGGVVYGEDT